MNDRKGEVTDMMTLEWNADVGQKRLPRGSKNETTLLLHPVTEVMHKINGIYL